MKKAGLTISTILFSLFLIIPSLSFAHGDDHDKSSDHGKESRENMQYEEGSGSSAVEPSHEGKEYKADHHEEEEDEGSFSYKRHRKEMKEKKEKKAHDSSHKKEEGSGSR